MTVHSSPAYGALLRPKTRPDREAVPHRDWAGAWGIICVVMRPWLAVPVVLALGLGVRAFTGGDFAKYAGVALYTTLIYALLSFWLRPIWAALTATGISWAVEFFQLTGIPADLSAHSVLARLVLGSTFNTPDLFWYAAGAALGVAIVRARPAR